MVESILDVILRNDELHTIDFDFFRVSLNPCSAVTVCPVYTRRLEVLIPPTELGILSWFRKRGVPQCRAKDF